MEELKTIREALENAAMVFKKYSAYHESKGTEDGERKAMENMEHCLKCANGINALDAIEERLGREGEDMHELVKQLEYYAESSLENLYNNDADFCSRVREKAAINVIRGINDAD